MKKDNVILIEPLFGLDSGVIFEYDETTDTYVYKEVLEDPPVEISRVVRIGADVVEDNVPEIFNYVPDEVPNETKDKNTEKEDTVKEDTVKEGNKEEKGKEDKESNSEGCNEEEKHNDEGKRNAEYNVVCKLSLDINGNVYNRTFKINV